MKNRLRSLIEENGMTQVEVAQKAGINRVYLNHVLTGVRKPTEKTLLKILVGAFDYKTSEASSLIQKWKLEEAARQLPEDKARLIMQDLMSGDEDSILVPLDPSRDLISTPILGHIVCGPLRQSDAIGDFYWSKDLIRRGHTYYTLIADGLSMFGKVDPGDNILIEQCSENKPGKIMVFRIGDEYALGYLYIDQDGFVEVRKSNREFPPIKIGDSSFEICGVVRAITKVNP